MACTKAVIDTQRLASTPQTSVWVDASAGTGKTKILTDRVLRFLLDGVPPSKILCLTFTKAAAAEMLHRVQTRLSQWVHLSLDTLVSDLQGLTGSQPETLKIQKARQLFYDLIDDPYGIRIMTIHSFCQQILTKFPGEAGLTNGFTLINEVEYHRLLEVCFNHLLIQFDQDPLLKGAFTNLQKHYKPQALIETLHETLFDAKLRQNLAYLDLEAYQIQLKKHLDLRPIAPLSSVLSDRTHYQDALESLNQGGIQDQKNAALIRDLLTHEYWTLDHLKPLFFTTTGQLRQRFVSKKVAEQSPWLTAFFTTQAEALLKAVEEDKKTICYDACCALLTLAKKFLSLYQDLKSEKHLLDFEDLIQKTTLLLAKEQGISWVLYKLDGGIDHLLVDEAQDSSPSQWQIITLLASDFFSGQGRRDHNRTLFVVGDRKQSIYSFQGAEPDLFHHLKHVFSKQVQAASKQWRHLDLNVSFRSCQAVLDAVNATFQNIPPHHSFRPLDGGTVELWPLVINENPENAEPAIGIGDQTPDHTPANDERTFHHQSTKRLADLIAKTISSDLKNQVLLPAKGRAVKPKDYMILVQRRSTLMYQIIRALKQAGVPVAGPDRFFLNQHIAVQDLVALGHFILHVEDDYALACALKSPLFYLNEDDLLFLTTQRQNHSLWSTLKKVQSEKPALKDAYDILVHLLKQAPHRTPYLFYYNLLVHFKGRQKFFARLGEEVEDVLDAFLDQAFTYGKKLSLHSGGHLQGFLSYLECVNPEIKRDFSSSNLEAVRIMTVHGAKGLQAPIIYLPDTTRIPTQLPFILWSDAIASLPLWRAPESQSCELIHQQKQQDKAKLMAEYERLLYVAMTRAEDKLVICGYENELSTNTACWYETIRSGLVRLKATSFTHPHQIPGDGLIYTLPQQRSITPAPSLLAEQKLINEKIPSWLHESVRLETESSDPISPSQALTSWATTEDQATYLKPLIPEADQSKAMNKGSYAHKLLEILPGLAPHQRIDAARIIKHLYNLTNETDLTQAVFSLLADPRFQDVFAPNSYAEIAVTGTVANQKFNGKIDRLIFGQDQITIIDFKSTQEIPTCVANIPKDYLVQLMIYQQLIQACHPDKKVMCEIIWIRRPLRMPIPEDMLQEEYQRYAQPNQYKRKFMQ